MATRIKSFWDIKRQVDRIYAARRAEGYDKLPQRTKDNINKAISRATYIQDRYGENIAGVLGGKQSMILRNVNQFGIPFPKEVYTNAANGDKFRAKAKRGMYTEDYEPQRNAQLDADQFAARLGNRSIAERMPQEYLQRAKRQQQAASAARRASGKG